MTLDRRAQRRSSFAGSVCAGVATSLLATGCVEVPRARSPSDTGALPIVASQARVSTTRLVTAITPIGRVPYDGATLPLVGPGLRVATRLASGAIALADPAEPGLAGAARENAARPLTPEAMTLNPVTARLPAGTMLGRSCDASGFLVEADPALGPVLGTASRELAASRDSRDASGGRVGLINWAGDRVAWLVDAREPLSAMATLLPELRPGLTSIAFCRLVDGAWQLVVRKLDIGSGQVRRVGPDHTLSLEGESLVVPVAGESAGFLVVLSIPSEGSRVGPLDALVIRRGVDRLDVVHRAAIGPFGTLADAAAAVAPIQTPWPSTLGRLLHDGRARASAARDGVILYSPGAFTAVWLDAGSGTLLRLPGADAGDQFGPATAGMPSGWSAPADGFVMAEREQLVLVQPVFAPSAGASASPGGAPRGLRRELVSGTWLPRRAWGGRIPARTGPEVESDRSAPGSPLVLLSSPSASAGQDLGAGGFEFELWTLDLAAEARPLKNGGTVDTVGSRETTEPR
jgi:hypothetical protein